MIIINDKKSHLSRRDNIQTSILCFTYLCDFGFGERDGVCGVAGLFGVFGLFFEI